MTECEIFKNFVLNGVPIKMYPWHSYLNDVINGKDPMSIDGVPIHHSLPERRR